MIEVGVTATRRGLNSHQLGNIYRWILADKKRIRKLHHGMCVGGDEEINDAARSLGIYTVGHPPTDTRYLSTCVVDEEWEPEEYLTRNRIIVNNTSELLVAPYQDEHPASIRGSGTWYTHDYAKDQKHRVVVFWPTKPFEVFPFDLPVVKVCIGCDREQGDGHEDWCPVVTGRLSSLDDKPK
jgi:hypothetical protein